MKPRAENGMLFDALYFSNSDNFIVEVDSQYNYRLFLVPFLDDLGELSFKESLATLNKTFWRINLSLDPLEEIKSIGLKRMTVPGYNLTHR